MPANSYRINLAEQQAECALNYVRLLRLLPQIRAADVWQFSLPAGEHLQFRVIERGPYTTTLAITQQAGHRWVSSECQVRVYHDAQLAEVVAFQGQRRIQPVNDYPNPQMHQIDEKARLNDFLGEWLAHCLLHGHSETPDAMPLDMDVR